MLLCWNMKVDEDGNDKEGKLEEEKENGQEGEWKVSLGKGKEGRQ